MWLANDLAAVRPATSVAVAPGKLPPGPVAVQAAARGCARDRSGAILWLMQIVKVTRCRCDRKAVTTAAHAPGMRVLGLNAPTTAEPGKRSGASPAAAPKAMWIAPRRSPALRGVVSAPPTARGKWTPGSCATCRVASGTRSEWCTAPPEVTRTAQCRGPVCCSAATGRTAVDGLRDSGVSAAAAVKRAHAPGT